MSDLSGARTTFLELARRPYVDDFTAVVPALGDLGRGLTRPDERELRRTLSSMAALREALEVDHVNRIPELALKDSKSGVYVGGALFASATMVDAFLRQSASDAEAAASFSHRYHAREAIQELLRDRPVVSPKDVRAHLETKGIEGKPDTVSKAIGELLAVGALRPTDPPPGADRRLRFYRAADEMPVDPEVAQQADAVTETIGELAAKAGDGFAEAVTAAALRRRSWRAAFLAV